MDIEVTFRHLAPRVELEQLVFAEADHLNRMTGHQLTWCHAVIGAAPPEPPHRPDLSRPGGDPGRAGLPRGHPRPQRSGDA